MQCEGIASISRIRVRGDRRMRSIDGIDVDASPERDNQRLRY